MLTSTSTSTEPEKRAKGLLILERPKVWRLPFTNVVPNSIATCYVPGGLLGRIKGIWLSGRHCYMDRIRMVVNALPVLDFPEWYDPVDDKRYAGGHLLEMRAMLEGAPTLPELPGFALPLMDEGSHFRPVKDPGQGGMVVVELTLSRDYWSKEPPDLFVFTRGDGEACQ
jgi:hypothetical protein